MKYANKLIIFLILTIQCLTNEKTIENGHIVNFPNIPIGELLKFISKTTSVNFIVDQKLLNFEVSLICGKSSTDEELLSVIIDILDKNDLSVSKTSNYLIINKKQQKEKAHTEIQMISPAKNIKQDGKFYRYKLKYHTGSEILDAIKQISSDIIATGSGDEDMFNTIKSIQWIKSTNSFLLSGSKESIEKTCSLIDNIDVELKQVFIEVLVIETNLGNSLDFGVQWSLSSKFKNNNFSIGTNRESDRRFSFANGLNIGIIGDIISHKGRSFLSLDSLITALQQSRDSTIILNQKIITQENKLSTIFVGNNIPFAGSVVQTIGSGQQTTANIEYRDVGVNLNITPLLGDGDVITLEISEEITEALDHMISNSNQLSGIKTSKTNMATNVHVPNGHFLILSGMTKNVKTDKTTGPPCLGGLPIIGNIFNKKENNVERSNLLIFVKPQIINSTEQYEMLSKEL